MWIEWPTKNHKNLEWKNTIEIKLLYLSEYEFTRLVETKSLAFAVSLFRNKIISDLLSLDLLDILSKEVNQSIKVTNKRKYSS